MAAGFLQRRGARIEGRNVRVGRGEIDLVVWLGECRVAVEVKTVGPGATADDVADRISPAKLDQVRTLANGLASDGCSPPVRVDFVGVRVTPRGVTVNWRMAVA